MKRLKKSFLLNFVVPSSWNNFLIFIYYFSQVCSESALIVETTCVFSNTFASKWSILEFKAIVLPRHWLFVIFFRFLDLRLGFEDISLCFWFFVFAVCVPYRCIRIEIGNWSSFRQNISQSRFRVSDIFFFNIQNRS